MATEAKIDINVPDADSFATLVGKSELGIQNVFDLAIELENGETKSRQISFGRRELQPEQPTERAKQSSPPREHVFHDVESFTYYLAMEVEKGNAATVFADAKIPEAKCVLNENSTDGFEVVSYRPTIHPLLASWMDGPWRAIEFAKFVIENRRSIVDVNLSAQEIAMLFRQIQVAKNVIINKGAGKNSLNGVMVETVIKSGNKSDVHESAMELPDEITVKLPVFVNSNDVQEMTFDLFVYNVGDDAHVSATNCDLQTMINAAFISDIQAMSGKVEGLAVTFGECRFGNWKRVV